MMKRKDEKMERLKDVVDKKKEKSANTKPKYGMRKLSVGLVPVFLGAIVLIPGVGYAKEVSVGATSAPRTEIVGEVLSRRDDKKDEEYAIQKVEAVSNQEGLEATSTSRSSANIVEENESINKNSKENDKEIVSVLNEDKSTEDHREMVKNEDRTVDEKLVSEEPQTENKENKEDKEEKEEKLEISEEKKEEAQKAGEVGEQNKEDKNLQKADDPNYGEDEKKIQDYNESERYKETDLQPGNVNQELNNTDEKQIKDGFKVDFKNPSAESPSKTEYGYQITIDKKTGQRTYTKVYVTDSGLVPAELGEKTMMDQGDKFTPESPDLTFTPDEKGEITASGKQRNLNYEASEETLKHINNKDNSSTSFGMKDNYTQDKPRVKFFGDNFVLGYKVNPWPNENDKLEELKLNTNNYDPKKKFFVQGQDIDTGIKVDNIDESAKERLVGQVYNPITGKVVPGASAYIGDNGNIHIKMPEGALKKDENGKTVINEDSIFNTPDYKALQNLDVRFFARPRTAEEFKTIAETPDEFGETGTYTGSGAGTADINHKGTNVKIDKQGIDRYDHYNLIGSFKLNLDDTRYYNQNFEDGNGDDTSKNTSSNIRPNEPFKVKMFTPIDKSKTDKTAAQMNAADVRGEANGRLIMDFIKKANEGKSEDDKWKIEASPNNISEFSITAPASAKAGDFIAIPVEYTYTNGSKDIHWFHFVVQESDNNIPTYESEAGIADKKLSQKPELSKTEKDQKKLKPKAYKLAKTEYKDDKGNVWNVSIDEETGEITATVPGNDKIPETGTKLNVDVEVIYEEEVEVGDKKETKTYTEKTRAQFYSIPSTRQEVKKEYETKLPFETKLIYDDTIPAGKVVEEGGVVGKQKMVFSQIVVGNKEGALDENGNFVEGKEAVTTEVVEKAQDKIIRIGTKPAETTVEIPKGLDYELDYSKKDGEPEVVEEGNDGVVTIKTTRDPQTGEITVTKTTTTEAKNKKIKIPAGTEGTHEYTEKKPFTYDIQFDKDFYKNYPDAKDNYKIVTEGKVGEKTTKWTIKNSKIVGEAEIIKDTDPTNAVIKVGQKDYTGTITHTESHEVPFEVEYKYSNELEAGQTKVEQKGEKGSYDVEYSQKIKNGEKDGELTSAKKNEKAAKKEIIVVGTKPVTKVVEKPFNTEYQYDENLEAGKTEEVTPGKNGKVTITTSYDETQKKIVTSETEEAGQNRVVKIGGKTNGTVEILDKVAYEVEVIKDDTLDAGTFKTVQEGIDGEKKTTLTIENSKEIEDKRKEEITKQPVKKIIKIGTKPNDKMCPAPENPNTHGDQKPNGPKEEEPGRPGESSSSPKTPNKPGDKTPSEPGKKASNKPGENLSEDPKNTPQESPEKVKEAEKAKEADEEIETEEAKVLNQVEQEEDEEASSVGNEVGKAKIAGDDKAPKTGDAGLMAETASAGLASGLLLLLGRFKRKKEDEE